MLVDALAPGAELSCLGIVWRSTDSSWWVNNRVRFEAGSPAAILMRARSQVGEVQPDCFTLLCSRRA